jgi:hypothetical protein
MYQSVLSFYTYSHHYSGIGPSKKLKKHNIHQISEPPVGANDSDHPFFHTFCKLRDRGLSLGDMSLVTPDCNWTAGSPIGGIAWHRHDEVIDALWKDELNASKRETLLAEGKPHTELFVLYDSPATFLTTSFSCVSCSHNLHY